MKKILIIIFFCVFLCGCQNKTPQDAVKNYLEQYRNFTKEVTNNLKEKIDTLKLTTEEKSESFLAMKKQFVYLKYKIRNTNYQGDEAIVTADVNVFDYRNYNKEPKRITYTLEFHCYYENDTWLIYEPEEETIAKIYGLYDCKA